MLTNPENDLANYRLIDLQFFDRRPSGNPGKDLLAHDYSVLQAHKEQLQLFSQELRSEVENDKERLVKVIEEIRKREDLIEEKLLKNEQSLQILGHGLK